MVECRNKKKKKEKERGKTQIISNWVYGSGRSLLHLFEDSRGKSFLLGLLLALFLIGRHTEYVPVYIQFAFLIIIIKIIIIIIIIIIYQFM